ncbi:hypothetical protein KKC45_03495, partial [Patescibacteria group bacterium]|nr:hypothetical protein [Patescibacteria group bacterium]
MIPAGEIFLNGKKYISSKKASKLTGYTNDYVGQLCRGNKIESQMVGRARFVEEGSLLNYAKKPKGNEKSFFNKTEDNKNLKNVFEKTADLKNKILAPQYLIFGQKVVTMVLMFVVAFGGYKFSETPFAQASFEKISSSSDIVGRALYNFAGGTSEKISETGRKIVLGSQDISGRIILGTNSILDIAENNISGAINNFAEVQNNKKVAQLEGEEEGVSETLSVATKEISFGENKSVVTESFLSLISGGVTKFAQSVFSKVNSSSSFIKSGSENKVASLQKVYTESIGYIIVGTNSSVTSVGNSVIRLTINLSENIKLGVTSATNLVLGLTNKTKNQLSNFAIINKENKNEILVQKNKEETPALSKSKLLENQKLVKGLNSSIGFVNSSVKKTVEETFSFYKNYFDLVTKTSTKFAKAEIGYLQNIKSSNKKILGSINIVKNILVDSPKFAVRSFENFVSTYEGGLEGVVALNENIKDVSRDNTKVALKIQNTNFENPTKNINNDGEIFEKSFGVFTFAKNIKKQGNEFVQNIIGGVNFLSISFAKSIDSLAMTSKNKLTGLSDLTKNKSNDFTNNLALAARETEQISKTKVETFAHDFYQTVNGLFDKSGKTTVIVKEEEVKKELEEEPVQIVREIVQPIEQTTVVNPIRERTVETRVERVVSGVTLADLQALNNELRAEIYRVADNSTVQTSNNYRAIALTNKIDNLSSVTINNSTITGGTITGATFSGSTLNLSSSLSGSSGSFSGNLSSGGNITASGNITAGGNLLTSGQLTVSGTATSTMAGDFAFNSSTLYIDSINGRVGIGTTSPEDTLAINGVAYFAPISAPSNTADRLYNVSNDLYWAGNLIGGATSANWTLSGSDAYRLTGNVGIGTTSPTHKLSVEGTSSLGNQARAGYFTATTSTATSTFAGGLTVGIDKFVVDNSTGYVGIGTTSPEYALEINGSSQNGIYIANSDYSGSYTIISPGEEIIIDKSSLSLSGDPGFYTFQDGIQLLSFAWDDELVEGISLRVANDVGPQKISLREGVSIGENYKSYLPPIMGLIVEGNVGIGTTSPLAKLSVKGAGTTTGINFQTTNSNNTSLMTVLDNGYVGIGIDSPTEALDVNGNVNALGGLGVRRGFSIGSNEILQSSSGDTYLISPLEKNIYLRTDGTSAGVTRMTIQNTTGNIGIGTTSPFAKLSVVGDGYFTGGKVTASTLTATSSMSAPYFTATSATATSTFAGGLNVANGGLVYDYSTGNVGIGNIPSQKLTIESSSNASSPLLITESGGGTLFLIRELSGGDSEIRGYDTDGNLDVNLSTNGDSYLDGGNLGIGTTSPFAKLAVTNTGTGNSFLVEDSISPDSSPFVITSSGSIGIGTANPDTLLHIYTTSDTGLRIESVDEISRLILKDNVGQAFIEGRGSSIIMPSGNVGIGTTSPFAKLSVVGDGYFTGGTVTASTLTATSSMSAPYFTATSATATSTFAGGLNVANGGLVYDYSTGNVG